MIGKKVIMRLLFISVVAVVLFQGGRQIFMKEEWAARNYMHEQVKSAFPDAARRASGEYGLSLYKNGERLSGDIQIPPDRPGPVAVLVHGLDEPGRIWLNLAPVLDAKGFAVFYMTYPNDQRITASARLFFDSLKEIDPQQGKDVVIISHSMGGLVSREMLTSPDIDYKSGKSLGLVPGISRLIMVGTPNHGSQLARFRLVMEIRDQVQALLKEDAPWLQGLIDGTGAAGLDLIPGSPFLTRLNSRPHPQDINLHVIAGILSPWSRKDIKAFSIKLDKVLTREKDIDTKGLETALITANETLGDGLVTVASATLENIPLTRVHGNHMTMIRNLSRESRRVPPAIPVILDILGQNQE